MSILKWVFLKAFLMDTLILNGGYMDSLSHFVPDLHILTGSIKRLVGKYVALRAIKMQQITSLPYFRVKLSCVCLMFAYRKKSNDL